MGSHEGWTQPDGFYPNGLLPDEAASVTRMLDEERWSIAEERIAELIARIQPNKPSEDQRNAVADYVQQLIAKCFSCQVFTFGSVPLKTYLPDGDIDLTAFSKNQNLKDTWASEVRDMLENEEKRENAEFRVKEVQHIQAEVKIIKCLVENIVVDISFNQLGGLCTLCFLEEVDSLINQNHLFKRSVILIKAWCYYESRILGAHHGLISTYALETLVLYIFHVFNNDFTGPLEVLYRFLEFFGKFDWENFCVSLWGPVPISSLPDVIADPPRKDGGELLLGKVFLRACSTAHSVFPGGQENNELPFNSKHFNVIDPLRTNNNLGRSVSKGNFFRIRSAFAFGAQRLARLLDCPKENIIAEVDRFFLNTWDRHGKGHRPDALNSDLYGLRCLNMNLVNGFDNLRNSSSGKKDEEKFTGHESKLEENRGSHAANGVLSQQDNQLLKRNSRTTNNAAGPQSQKKFAILTCSVASDQNRQMPPGYNSNLNVHIDKGRNWRPDYLWNKMNSSYHFARTHSSPELTECSEISNHGRQNWASESIKEQAAVTRLDYSRRNIGLQSSDDNSARSLREEIPPSRQISSLQSIKPAVDSDSDSNRYYSKSGLSAMQEDQTYVGETMQMHQEEQDLVNMMSSSRVHSLGGHVQMPLNFGSAHLPLPSAPSILASLGHANRNSDGMVPNGNTSFEMPCASQTHYTRGLVSMPVSQFTSNLEIASHHQEEIVEQIEGCLICKDTYHDDCDHVQWSNQNTYFLQGFDIDDENFQARQLEEKMPLSSGGSTVISATHLPTPENYLMKVLGSIKEDRSVRENYGDNHRHQNTKRSEVYSPSQESVRENYGDNHRHQNTKRSEVYSPSQESVPAANSTSSRSKLSSEGSCDGLSMKSSKSMRDRGERKPVPSAEHSTVCKHESDSVDYVSSQADDDRGEWIPLSTIKSEAAEDMVPGNVAPSLVRFHQIPSYEAAELRESYSMVPVASVPVCSDSRKRTYDNNDALPFAFYPAGPPVPFVTMLPFYNFPTEMGSSDESGSHFERDEEFNNSHINQYGQRLTENLEHPQCSSQSNMEGAAPVETSGENKSDILNGDFGSHWQNLQYGRFCQSPWNQGHMSYPSPVVVPPMYIQGHLPWDGPGRPLSANANLFTQLMGYGPGAVPVSSLQPGSNRPGSVYQSSGDQIPRYRHGTGTYLPNPQRLSSRDQQSSSARNNRGDYSKDHNGDRDLNWNINSKKRFAGHGEGRSKVERPNTRIDRSIANKSQSDDPQYSFQPDRVHSNHSQNGLISSSNSSRHGSKNVAYGMYPPPVMNPNGVAPSATTVPSVVMFYPYEQNMGCDSPTEQQLKFGSIGPMHFSNINGLVHLGESSSRDAKEQWNIPVDSGHSSPDLPSSPMHQRGV